MREGCGPWLRLPHCRLCNASGFGLELRVSNITVDGCAGRLRSPTVHGSTADGLFIKRVGFGPWLRNQAAGGEGGGGEWSDL